MKDDDIHTLFSQPMRFDDEAVFHERIMGGLKTKTWFRQGLIALAGIAGGLYALVQFVRLPGLTAPPALPVAQGATPIVPSRSEVTFEAELGMGREMVDTAVRWLAQGLGKSTDYLLIVQSPAFFWISFSLCMTIVGLYLVNMREESL